MNAPSEPASPAFLAGVEAAARGVKIIQNPFKRAVPEYREWRCGWKSVTK